MDGYGNEIGKGILTGVFILGLVCVLIFWVVSMLPDWLFMDDSIKTTEPIIPELEITVKNNVIDTLYVYRDIED